MPVYTWECPNCGYTITDYMSITEYENKIKDGVMCPECKNKMIRNFNHKVKPAIKYKSSGFYTSSR